MDVNRNADIADKTEFRCKLKSFPNTDYMTDFRLHK
ncbi:MAG: hypothetical protein H6Q20_2297 [Bacteroidetes bacterium]|nr:hypothetical protein [Bacteroidota bacterium]